LLVPVLVVALLPQRVGTPRPLWGSLLVYVTVFITVLSGADYFFGVLRRRPESDGCADSGGGVKPRAPAGVNR
jgi:hypothetical protein